MLTRGQSRVLRWSTVIVFLLCFTLIASATAFADVLYWDKKTDMSTARSRAASGVVNGEIYVLGGDNRSGSILNAVERYNPQSDSWTPVNPLSDARFAAACATVGNSIFVLGGRNSSGITGSILEYNTSGNGSCSSKGSLSTARFRASAAVLNGKIYVVGGRGSSGVLGTIEEIDPGTGASNTMPTTLNPPRELPAVVAVGTKLYIIGGFDASGNPLSDCLEYDPATGLTSKASMPSPRGGIRGAVTSGNKVYIAGGVTAMPPLAWTNDVQEYDPATNSWRIVGSLPTSRYAAIAEVVNNRLYVIGGDNNSQTLKINESAYLQQSEGDFTVTFSSSGGEQGLNCGAYGTVKISLPSGTYTNETLSVSVLNTGPKAVDGTVRSLYFDISTTAGISGTVTVTVPYNPTFVADPQNLKLYHWNGSNWEALQTTVNTSNNTVSGQTTSLSPFVVAEPSSIVPASSTWSLILMAFAGVAALWYSLRRRLT